MTAKPLDAADREHPLLARPMKHCPGCDSTDPDDCPRNCPIRVEREEDAIDRGKVAAFEARDDLARFHREW